MLLIPRQDVHRQSGLQCKVWLNNINQSSKKTLTTIIQACAPTTEAEKEGIESFYESIQEADHTPKQGMRPARAAQVVVHQNAAGSLPVQAHVWVWGLIPVRAHTEGN